MQHTLGDEREGNRLYDAFTPRRLARSVSRSSSGPTQAVAVLPVAMAMAMGASQSPPTSLLRSLRAQ